MAIKFNSDGENGSKVGFADLESGDIDVSHIICVALPLLHPSLPYSLALPSLTPSQDQMPDISARVAVSFLMCQTARRSRTCGSSTLALDLAPDLRFCLVAAMSQGHTYLFRT